MKYKIPVSVLVVVFTSAGCQRSQQQPLFGGTANNFNNGSLFANNQNGGPFGAAGLRVRFVGSSRLRTVIGRGGIARRGECRDHAVEQGQGNGGAHATQEGPAG